jgi:hypothetical protein
VDFVYYPMGNEQVYVLKVEGFEWIWCITVQIITNNTFQKLRDLSGFGVLPYG